MGCYSEFQLLKKDYSGLVRLEILDGSVHPFPVRAGDLWVGEYSRLVRDDADGGYCVFMGLEPESASRSVRAVCRKGCEPAATVALLEETVKAKQDEQKALWSMGSAAEREENDAKRMLYSLLTEAGEDVRKVELFENGDGKWEFSDCGIDGGECLRGLRLDETWTARYERGVKYCGICRSRMLARMKRKLVAMALDVERKRVADAAANAAKLEAMYKELLSTEA